MQKYYVMAIKQHLWKKKCIEFTINTRENFLPIIFPTI